MTDRLKLYNGALQLVGARDLSSLTEEQETRRQLDLAWNDGAVRFCLEQAQWKFAMRGARIDYNPSIEPTWGLRRAFTKPDDWVITSALCSDEFFQTPLLQYVDEAGFWYADVDEIYVRYVSDDSSYGGDLSRWPFSFADYVKAYLAAKVVAKLTGDKEIRDRILHPRDGILTRALGVAKNKDAMAGPTLFPAPGSWVSSRFGRTTRRDIGNRGRLIG